MKDIGIRELKARASELVRHVAEDHATYAITRRGRTVGVLAPSDFLMPSGSGASQQVWNRVLALADQMGGRRGSRRSAIRELETMRR
jgi:prevent-host-death family protein